MVDKFRTQGDALAGAMIPAGHNLVGHLAIIALVLAVAWPVLSADLGPIISTLIAFIAVTFVAIWLIDETTVISRSIDSGLIRIAATATGVSPDLTPGQVMEQGLRMVQDLNAAATAASTKSSWDFYTSIINAAETLGLTIGVAILAFSFAFYKILAYAIVPLTTPLLALLVLPITRGFGMGVFKFWISTAIGLMTIVFFAGMETQIAHLWIQALDNACHMQYITIITSPTIDSMAGPHTVRACTQTLSTDDAMGYMLQAMAYALVSVRCTYYVSQSIGAWAGHGLEHAGVLMFATNQVSRVASSAANNSATQGGAAARDAAWARVKETIQNSIP